MQTSKVLYWAPRVLGIAMAIFISLFALDVFEEGRGLGEMLIGFAIHLIPTFILIAVLVLAWKWEWIGAIFFIALGVFYIYLTWSKFNWTAWLIISGPLFLIGILFAVNWLLHRKTATVQ